MCYCTVHIELQYLSKHVLLYRTCRVKISVKTCVIVPYRVTISVKTRVIVPYISIYNICQNMCYCTVHIELQYLSKLVLLYRTYRVTISVKTCVIVPYRVTISVKTCVIVPYISSYNICQNMCYCNVHIELLHFVIPTVT